MPNMNNTSSYSNISDDDNECNDDIYFCDNVIDKTN